MIRVDYPHSGYPQPFLGFFHLIPWFLFQMRRYSRNHIWRSFFNYEVECFGIHAVFNAECFVYTLNGSAKGSIQKSTRQRNDYVEWWNAVDAPLPTPLVPLENWIDRWRRFFSAVYVIKTLRSSSRTNFSLLIFLNGAYFQLNGAYFQMNAAGSCWAPDIGDCIYSLIWKSSGEFVWQTYVRFYSSALNVCILTTLKTSVLIIRLFWLMFYGGTKEYSLFTTEEI